jgi:hypothetical protein
VFKPVGFDAQDVPSYSSVAATTGLGVGVVSPPKAKPAVCVPQPPKYLLAVFKLLEFTQEFPSYSSVAAEIGSPPKAKPAVCVPQPPKAFLAVFKGLEFVQQLDSLDLMLLPRCFVLVYLYNLPY